MIQLVLAIVLALGVRELWGWIPVLVTKLIEGAVAQLPESQQPRWGEEWRRHAVDFDDRRLSALVWALELRYREVGKLRDTLAAPSLSRSTSTWGPPPAVGLALMHVLGAGMLVLLWFDAVGYADAALFLVMYTLTGLGITVGYHRLLTHGAFRTHHLTRYVLVALGSMAAQGPVLQWVADDRRHHSCADEAGDPHSPHLGRRRGVTEELMGLGRAHLRSVSTAPLTDTETRQVADLLDDAGIRLINKTYPLWVLLSLALPTIASYAYSGTTIGAVSGLVCGGFARLVAQTHVLGSINSLCHYFGSRRFGVDDFSTNLWWLALPSLGDSWHHNHHAFPGSAAHGLRRLELDPSAAAIRLMQKTGLAWDLVDASPSADARPLELQAASHVHD